MTERDALPDRLQIRIVVALVVCGVLLRLVFPGADAIHPRWHGWMTDEGRWTELAREWALFRDPDLDSPVSRVHLLIGPLFQGTVAAAFEWMGVGLEAARLPSRVAGVALLVTAVLSLRRALNPWAWVGMTALVALHPELVYFSRVAIPEMPALLAGFGAFLLVVRPEASRRSDVLAGVLTAVAVGFKATTLLYLPAFALALLVIGRPRDQRPLRDRLLQWGAGVILPLGLGAALAAVTLGPGSPGTAGTLETVLGFVRFNDLYHMGTAFLLGESMDDVNLLLAVLCPLWVAVLLRDPPDSAARRIHRGAAAWACAWLIPLVLLDYFPPRYVVHLHLALILTVTGAIALVSDPRGRPLAEGWASWGRGRRFAAGALVGLPLAVVAVPALLVAVNIFGPRLDRIRIVLPLLCLVVMGAGVVAVRRPVAWIFGPAFVVFPLAAAVTWRAFHGPAAERYWVADAATELLPWGLALAVGLGAAGALRRSWRRVGSEVALAVGSLAYLAALVVLWTGIRHLPALGRPSYELAALSDVLTERYPAEEVIGVAKLTGALIETPFRYRELGASDSLPDVVLTTIWSPDLPPGAVLDAGFRTVAEFEMPVFLFRGDPRPPHQPLFDDRMPVELLERRDAGRPGG